MNRQSVDELRELIHQHGYLPSQYAELLIVEVEQLRTIEEYANNLISKRFNITLPSSGAGRGVFKRLKDLTSAIRNYRISRFKK